MTDWAKVKLDVDRNLPLYSQISEKLRSMILSGDLKKGERIPPSSELQQIFSVSAITVENGITALVKEQLLLRRPRLGTYVAGTESVRQQLPPSGKMINIVFNSNRPGGHSYFEWICALEQICKADGYMIRFTISHPDTPESVEYLAANCAGVILMGMPKLQLVRALQQKLPLVLIGDPEDDSPQDLKDLDYVVNDDAGRAYQCIRHLVDLGHRQIMAIITPANTPYERSQRSGLERAAKEFKLTPEELQIHSVPDYLQECGYKAAYPALCSAPRPTACMATEASLAIGIMKAASDLGLSIPKDLSLITFGSQFDCERKEPQLTCFESNIMEIARNIIWKKLKGQLEKPKYKPSKTVVPAGKFFFGNSTRYYKGEK